MRVIRSDDVIELQSTPGCYRLFSLCFVAAGVLALTVLALTPDLTPTQRAVAGLVGAGVLAGGLFSLATTPRISLQFDLDAGWLSYQRTAPLRRRVLVEAPIPDVRGIRLRQDYDSDGDPWYVLVLSLEGHDDLELESGSVHYRASLDDSAAAIGEALRLARGADGRRPRLREATDPHT